MKTKQLFLFSLAFILTLVTIMAWQTDVFGNNLSRENLTFTGNENVTRYLNVSENKIVLYGRLNISGYFSVFDKNITNLGYAEEGTGFNPSYPIANAFDGDWDTYAEDAAGGGNTQAYANFTLRNDSDAEYYSAKMYLGTATDSVAIYCRDQGIQQYTIETVTGYDDTTIYKNFTLPSECKNSTPLQVGFQSSLVGTASRFYEGEIIYLRYPSNVSLYINDTQVWNYSGKFSSEANYTPDIYSEINSYIYRTTANNGNYEIPFVFHSDSAGILMYDTLIFNNSGFIENSQTFNATTFETSAESYSLNITYSSDEWTSIVGRLVYNGTNYTASSSGSGNDLVFTYNMDVPRVENPVGENRTFYWLITLANSTDTLHYTTDNRYQNVTGISLTYCAVGQTPFINFTTYDIDVTSTKLNATFEVSWEIAVEGSDSSVNASYSDTSEGNHSWAFCFGDESENYSATATIEFDATNYAKNYYYLKDYVITNKTTNVSLYLLNDSLATLTELEVLDESQSSIANVYITIQKYDVGTDTYYTSSMGKTSSEGSDLVYLNWYDTFYKFILVQEGSTILSTDPYKVGETPQTFQIIDESVYEFSKFEGIEYSLTFNNVTNNFVLTYVLPSGDVESACLRVVKRNITNDYTICDVCETSSSGTLYCNINSWGNGTFIGSFYATGSNMYIAVIEQLKGVSNAVWDELGNIDGTALAIIFAGVIVALFLVSPVFAIIGVLLALFAAMILGFQPYEYLLFIGLVVAGGIIIWLISGNR